MGIRQQFLTNTNRASNSLPEWVINGNKTTKELYQAAINEYTRVRETIENKESTKTNERKIILAKVARIANRSRSNVNKRHQPNLCLFILQANHELDELYKSNNKERKNDKPKSKKTLEKEISSLKTANKKLIEQSRRDFVEEIFQSRLLEDHDKLARDIAVKNRTIETLNVELGKLRMINSRIIDENATLHEILTTKQRAQFKKLSLVD